MRNLAFVSVMITCVSLALLQACIEPRNFDRQIRNLDSLHSAINRTMETLDSCTVQFTDTITQQLTFIQSNFTGEMKESMAHTLLRCGEFRGRQATLQLWKDSLLVRKDQLENEIYNLRSTLSDRATHDGTQREITEIYADSIAQSLITKQQHWRAKVIDWMQKQHDTYEEWRHCNDTLNNWCDSIPQRKLPL